MRRGDHDINGDNAMTEQGNEPGKCRKGERAGGIGCGLVLLLAGAGLFAENMGWIKSGTWLFPGVLAVLGVASIYNALRRR